MVEESDPRHFTEDQFFNRISGFATDDTILRHMPRKTRKEFTGICPCCGEPCAPYTTCKKYREMQSVGAVLRDLVDEKVIRIVGKIKNANVYQKNHTFTVDEKSRKKAKMQRKSRRKNR
jgi:hypothetical protein